MMAEITLPNKGEVYKTRILNADVLFLIKETVRLPTGDIVIHSDAITHDRRDDSYGKIRDHVTYLGDMRRWGVEPADKSEWDAAENHLVGGDEDDFDE